MSCKVAVPSCIPTSKECRFLLLRTLTSTGIVRVLDFHHPNRFSGTSVLVNLHFPNDILRGASFHMLVCHLYIFSAEVSVQVFCPLFNRVVHFLIVEF